MTRIAQYLFRHENGVYDAILDKRWYSLRTKLRREAKQRLRELLVKRWKKQVASEAAEPASAPPATASDSIADRATAAKVDLLMEQVMRLAELISQSGIAPQASRPGEASVLAVSGLSDVSYEKAHGEHLESLCNTVERDTQRMYRTGAARTLHCVRVFHRLQRTRAAKGKSPAAPADLWATLRDVGPDGVWNFYRRKQLGPSSLNHLRVYLSQWVAACLEKEWLPESILRRMRRIKILPVEPDTPTIPTPESMRLLLAACRSVDARSADIIEFTACTGCRPGGLSAVQWEDVNFVQRLIRFVQDGLREPADISQEAYDLLLRLKGGRVAPTGRIFEINEYRLRKARAVLQGCVKGLVAHGCEDLKDMTDLKALRHYFASVCVMAGVDFKTIALWLGHNDGGRLVAKTYGHLRRDHTQQAMKQVRFTAAR